MDIYQLTLHLCLNTVSTVYGLSTIEQMCSDAHSITLIKFSVMHIQFDTFVVTVPDAGSST